MKTLSKKSYILPLIIFPLTIFFCDYINTEFQLKAILLTICSVTPLILVIHIIFMINRLIYKMWDSLYRTGYARMTPSKAVGFGFVPVFSLFWIYPQFYGYAKDYNKLVREHLPNAPQLPEIEFFGVITLTYISIFPMLFIPVPIGILFSFVTYLIWLEIISNICDSVNILSVELDSENCTFTAQRVPSSLNEA